MQLTRDVSGSGWSLKRGTQLYGTLRGSEFEAGRAYIALVGFVDPDTNRMVRLQGNLLGSDGTDGLKGKKHNLNSGWSRTLKIAGAGVVDALGGVAGTLGRRPVYGGDIYGYGAPRAYSPLLQELNGIAYRNGRGGFVEVPAGTTGYLLVMTSPREMQGVDADVNGLMHDANRSSVRSARFSNERLSEEELAELLTSGSASEVRQALPRMTPEMRRVAETVLQQGR